MLGILAYDIRAACLGFEMFAGGFGWRFVRDESSGSRGTAEGTASTDIETEAMAVDAVASTEPASMAELPAPVTSAETAPEPPLAEAVKVEPAVKAEPKVESVFAPEPSPGQIESSAAESPATEQSADAPEAAEQEHRPAAEPHVLRMLQHRLDTNHAYVVSRSSNMWNARKKLSMCTEKPTRRR